MAQELVDNETEKINAIKALLNRNTKDNSISDELKVLLSENGINQITHDVALLWETQANLAQKLSHLALTASPEQKRIMGEIFELTDSLKKNAAKSVNLIEEERKKLIVVQEVFRKKTSEKLFNKSFKDKSFKLALEELLDEKSGVLPRKKPKKILEEIEDEDDDVDNTKFFSMVEYKEEIDNVKHSFIANQKESDFIKETLTEVIEETKLQKSKKGAEILPRDKAVSPSITSLALKQPIHPFKQQLIETNQVFLAFPVIDSRKIRDQLPILRDPNVKINVWGILKDNMGKDLSKITMPVYLNEPITLLQKSCESLEYYEYLKTANNCDDQYLRLINVLASAFLVYTNAPNRMKKPFNPLLGETYEYIQADLKCIYEQVSHHPPILAFHAESNDFLMNGNFYLKSKLSISGFEFFPIGQTEIKLKKTKEIFVIPKRCNASLHNYIIGKAYLWFSGDMVVRNLTTGDEVTVNFKPKGWTAKNDFEVEGLLKDAAGNIKYHIFGKWDSFLSVIDANTKQETKIGTKHESVKDYELQYMFSKFTIGLNHLSVDTLKKTAPTDARLRPDQRAYENGNLELAASEKNRLEELQRKRRKENEARDFHWKPLWFDFKMEGEDFTSSYKGGYFETRESGKWPAEILDLYND